MNSLGDCSLSDDILSEFPYVVYGRWMSTTQPAAAQSESYVNDTINGWNIAIEQAAQTTTAWQQSKEQLVNPYGDRLRYCGGLDVILGKPSEERLLEKVMFYNLDGILVGSTALDADGNPFQDSTTVNTIKTSALTNTKIYAQSPTHNGMPGQWQPNGFNPKMEINGATYLNTGGAGEGGENNVADQTIGIPFPHCETFNCRINQNITSINIYAKCTQYIGANDDPPTGKLQRYPILAIVKFRLKNR